MGRSRQRDSKQRPVDIHSLDFFLSNFLNPFFSQLSSIYSQSKWGDYDYSHRLCYWRSNIIWFKWMFRWEGGAAFMILELDFIWTDYVRQLNLPCIPHFPGNDSYTWPGTFDRSPLGTQCPTLVCVLRKLQGGRRIAGPFYWACAQGQYGTRPKACMGLGSRCCTTGTGPRAYMGQGSWCRTIMI